MFILFRSPIDRPVFTRFLSPGVEYYRKEAHLIGVDTLKLSFEESAAILKLLIPSIEKGIFDPPEIDEVAFTDSLKAYEEINSGKAKHKKVIVFQNV